MTNEPTTFEEAVRRTASEIAELCIRKQADYGHDNITKFGEQGLAVRIWDKAARLRNLVWGSKVPENETVEDTFTDLAGYGILGVMYGRGWFILELEADK